MNIDAQEHIWLTKGEDSDCGVISEHKSEKEAIARHKLLPTTVTMAENFSDHCH